MKEFGAGDFEDLCRSDAVSAQLGSIEDKRKAALRMFWLSLVGGIVLGVGAWYVLSISGWDTAAVVVALVMIFGGLVTGMLALGAVSKELKVPVLEALATQGAMEYLPSGFAPPLYPEAKKALFGSWLSSETFSDLFHGKDEEGHGYAVYEGHLRRGSGKNSHTVFLGQVYALQRARHSEAVTVIVPDRGIFNFFKPARGMARVKVESDPEFEKRFEVYSTHEVEAKQLLFDSMLRRRLLDLRVGGAVFVYVGPEGALVAASGKDRFEPGSMFRSKSGEERVRLMFDDFCASMGVLKGLKQALG